MELPLALPTIIGGLRMSTVYTVSWAVLASMIGLGGLGDFIYAGVSSNDNALILLGAIPRPCWPLPWAPWWICSSTGQCPRGCGRGSCRMTLSMILNHLALVVAALGLCHSGRRPPGHPVLLLSPPPGGGPPGGGPDPDHPCPGPSGHHHGVHGAGKPTVIVGLALYSLLPIVRNTHLGLSQVPEYLIEAGQGAWA